MCGIFGYKQIQNMLKEFQTIITTENDGLTKCKKGRHFQKTFALDQFLSLLKSIILIIIKFKTNKMLHKR